jgi:hypothetical protein
MHSTRLLKDGVRLYLCLASVVLSCAAVAGCASDAAGSGDTSIVVEVLEDGITIENLTGTSLSKGEVTVVPKGIPRPYVMILPHMTNGSKRTFPFNSFRMSDGSPFRRDIANGRTVKVEAKDVSGKTYTREVPFK